MARISLIRPLDQPLGTRRLLADLKASLDDARYNEFHVIVAYAKTGPLYRLADRLTRWRGSGKRAEAIFGIDQQGTSYEALEFALRSLDAVYVTTEASITFHPKIYTFGGPSDFRAFVGSNNLTVGGTETNFESAVDLELDPAVDSATIAELANTWADLLPTNCQATRQLDAALLDELLADGDIVHESTMRLGGGSSLGSGGGTRRGRRSGLSLVPPSSLPTAFAAARAVASPTGRTVPGAPSTTSAVARGLAIQVKPHHNGEIFLSVVAVRQHPTFFGWPFTGHTTPKKATNPSYPQRNPDPVVDIAVYGAGTGPILTLSSYNLNTIYYSTKSEIRITASPLVGVVPDCSVMIIETSGTSGVDYDITIHTPASPDYARWLAACDQQMPGGGATPRRFGWF